MSVSPHIQPAFGRCPDGSVVEQTTITGGDAQAKILTWGARLADFRLTDVPYSLALGAQELAPYLGAMKYFGAVVGPVANRISNGRLPLSTGEVQLDRNERTITTLHGGSNGFAQRNWHVKASSKESVTLSLRDNSISGFPGDIETEVTYRFDDAGALTFEVKARAGAETWVGPAFHGYWNLDGTPDIKDHRLSVFAQSYTPVNDDLIPSAGSIAVEDSAFDYRSAREIDPALDHNFCLAKKQGVLRPACLLEAKELSLLVETTEVGVQVYSGSGLETSPYQGLNGRVYGANAGIAIEPQFWPDTPNNPDFPSSRLDGDQANTYHQVSRFTVTKNK